MWRSTCHRPEKQPVTDTTESKFTKSFKDECRRYSCPHIFSNNVIHDVYTMLKLFRNIRCPRVIYKWRFGMSSWMWPFYFLPHFWPKPYCVWDLRSWHVGHRSQNWRDSTSKEYIFYPYLSLMERLNNPSQSLDHIRSTKSCLLDDSLSFPLYGTGRPGRRTGPSRRNGVRTVKVP